MLGGASVFRSLGRVVGSGLIGSLVAVGAVTSCCNTPEFEMGDMGIRAEFGVNVAFDFEFSLDFEFNFDGDLSGWANLFAATSVTFNYDFSGKVAYATEVEIDIDDDGVAETVKFLGFSSTGSPDDIDRGFASWKGDEYSFDEGYCYVLSWQGDDAVLMTGRCGSSQPALMCPMPSGEFDAGRCEVCDDEGACAPCDSELVASCVSEGEAALRSNTSSSGVGGATATSSTSTTTGSSAGGAAGAAGEAGSMASGTTASNVTATGTTTGGSVEFDSCVEEVRRLEQAGAACGANSELDSTMLCEERLSDVNLCFLAVEGAGLFGSECDVVSSDVCDVVYR